MWVLVNFSAIYIPQSQIHFGVEILLVLILKCAYMLKLSAFPEYSSIRIPNHERTLKHNANICVDPGGGIQNDSDGDTSQLYDVIIPPNLKTKKVKIKKT